MQIWANNLYTWTWWVNFCNHYFFSIYVDGCRTRFSLQHCWCSIMNAGRHWILVSLLQFGIQFCPCLYIYDEWLEWIKGQSPNKPLNLFILVKIRKPLYFVKRKSFHLASFFPRFWKLFLSLTSSFPYSYAEGMAFPISVGRGFPSLPPGECIHMDFVICRRFFTQSFE